MKGKVAVVAALVLFLLGMESWQGQQKDMILRAVGTTIYRQACPMAGMEKESLVAEVLAGNPVYFRRQEGQEQMTGRLIYRENQSGIGTGLGVVGSGVGTGEEEEIASPGGGEGNDYSTAVVSENLKQVQTMAGGTDGTEAYVKRLWENKDVNYLWNHFYIVDSTTSVTKQIFNVENMLTRDMSLAPAKGKKQILLYHTHGASEQFSNSKKGKESDSIIGVGAVLAKELEKNGYGVVHDRTKYDLINGQLDRSKAYNASLEGMEKNLAQYPDIQVVIDLHRDAVGRNKHTYTMIDGKRTAIAMFFNGMSRSRSGPIDYLENPNLQANLAFSLQMKCRAMTLYDGFTKPIYLKGYRYNLHIKERSLLIELGNENNTVAEAKNAAAPLARVISDVLKGNGSFRAGS